jgi:hypothetical protein
MRIKIITAIIGKLSKKKRVSNRAIESMCNSLLRGTVHCYLFGITVKKIDGELIFSSKLDFIREHGYFFLMPSPGIYVNGKISVSVCRGEGGLRHLEPGDVSVSGLRIIEESFSYPLVVRNRIAGDAIKTEHGTMYVDDIIKSWNLDEKVRDCVPIIEDSDGILAITPGFIEGCEIVSARFRTYSGSREGPFINLHIKGA